MIAYRGEKRAERDIQGDFIRDNALLEIGKQSIRNKFMKIILYTIRKI